MRTREVSASHGGDSSPARAANRWSSVRTGDPGGRVRRQASAAAVDWRVPIGMTKAWRRTTAAAPRTDPAQHGWDSPAQRTTPAAITTTPGTTKSSR